MNIRTSGTSFLVTLAMWSGLEMEQAVTASGQSIEARPPAAADREAVWYPGYVQIRGADGDRNTRSLWLTGQAAAGKSMAMAGHRYQLEHVNSVAESHSDVRNDTFTNLSARKALQIATAAARASGEKADPLWERIARELYIPIDERAHHHLPFDPSIEAQSKDFGSGPLALLFLPALDLQMDPQLRQGNYDFAVRPASLARVGGFSMGLAPHVIAAAVIGNEAEATRWLDANYSGSTLKPPFLVRTETAGNNTGI